jgi:hypothetical protein
MIYWITFVAVPIAAGILAASGFIISKNPNARVLVDKIAPYKGFIGATALASGLYNIVTGLSMLSAGILGILLFVTFIVMSLTGFLLGFGLLAKYAGSAASRGAEIQLKLVAYEVPLGLLSIGGGVLCALFLLGIVHF